MTQHDTYTGTQPVAFVRPHDPASEINSVEEQWKLEYEMQQAGKMAFDKSVTSAKQGGSEDRTVYGATILKYRLQAVTEGIEQFLEDANTGKPGRRQTAEKYLQNIAPETAAYLALKGVVEGITEDRPFARVAVAIGGMVEDEKRLSALRETEKKAFERIVGGVQSRISYRNKRIYAIRVAQEHDSWERWTEHERLNVGAKLIDILVETTGIIEVAMAPVPGGKTQLTIKATEALLDWIERRTESASLLRPKYEPMIVPPREWEGPYGGGYLSSAIPPMPLVKSWNKAYLEELGSADMPIVYDAINAVQNVAWQVNKEVLSVMQALWDEASTDAGMPSRTGLELPEKPDDIAENTESRKLWRIHAAQVYKRNLSLRGSRVAVAGVMGVAARYAKYPAIYFPHQFDFRGRLYAVTTLSPQGADYTKGLLRFANGKPLGETGGSWLAYEGANRAGYDKVSLGERVQWVLDNEETILACAEDPLRNREWCGEIGGVEIDSPWQFLAFCFEWKGYCEQGDEFVSRLPVAMDGSCSGLQHFSAMLRDPVGGAAVNLVPSDKPQDVYRIVADKVLERIHKDITEGTEDALAHTKEGKAFVKTGTKTLAQQWLDFGVSRKVTQRSVMTLAYGSKEYGFRQQLMEDIVGPARANATKADGTIDRELFPFEGDGYGAAGYMAKLIWQAVTVTLTAAVGAMEWLQKAATLAAKENLPVRWTTPVGFPVMQAYHDMANRRVRTSIAGSLVVPQISEAQETLNVSKMANGISPNFVHSCDAAHLTLTVAMGAQEGLTNFAMIHDSFGTTAADMETFFHTVRRAFVSIYDDLDVLNNFRQDVVGILCAESIEKLPAIPSKGTLAVSQVEGSSYCFA